MIPVAYTSFNYYFDKRRVFVMSLTQTLKGFIIMSYPIVVQFLVDKYGFRGAALVVAALHGHAFFGMIVMHPIEWHHKTVKIPINEDEPCNYLLLRTEYFNTEFHILTFLVI